MSSSSSSSPAAAAAAGSSGGGAAASSARSPGSSGSVYDDTVAWYETDGSESFAERIITTLEDAYSVFAIDVDGDGDVDALSASYNDDTVACYENACSTTTVCSGSASLSSPLAVVSGQGEAFGIKAVDLDGDGDLDVVSGHSTSVNKVLWNENDGAMGFSYHDVDSSSTGTWGVDTSDVDGDMEIDVLAAAFDSDSASWYENDGSEAFSEHVLTASLLSAVDAYAGDVDGDGDVDVIAMGYGAPASSTIEWYENDGSQVFTTHTITSDLNGGSAIHDFDIDGDGDVDVVSS